MKIAIQGLGEVPATIEFLLEREKPEVTYILCSDYQMNHVASSAGYEKSNKDVIESAAKKTKTKVIFQKCDVFDPRSIGEAFGKIIKEIKPEDEIIINYTGGSAAVKMLLGAAAVVLSKFMPRTRIVYALRYKGGIEKYVDHTDELREIFKQLYELF
jgi:homoserine dehydrogenase